MKLKVNSFIVPYKVENGELILDDSKITLESTEEINSEETSIIKLSTKIGQENAEEKDLALAMEGVDEGFLTIKRLVE